MIMEMVISLVNLQQFTDGGTAGKYQQHFTHKLQHIKKRNPKKIVSGRYYVQSVDWWPELNYQNIKSRIHDILIKDHVKCRVGNISEISILSLGYKDFIKILNPSVPVQGTFSDFVKREPADHAQISSTCVIIA
jgi:hypothetical protein